MGEGEGHRNFGSKQKRMETVDAGVDAGMQLAHWQLA